MPLASGTRLGPYEIQSPLGAGGMGEVYRARDTRLDRTVAIKVLPEHIASDPELRQRFEREARALAALSHPHICPVFDVGSQEGIDFLVMEYLEGETLAQRLAKGALPLDQALRTAIEIADALDKAHRKGIVHRDLKPGNVMLTKAGAKLLDFGLAKLRPAAAHGAVALSAAPTVSSPLTSAGSIVGTFQYMAPEQLEGQEADARTDIFAFGAVVYEMVTGKKAFEGKSQASLISAIMSSEPEAVSSLQTLAPSALDQIVRTCLAKDPDERWQSTADVERQLKWIADGRSQVGTGPRVSVITPVRRTRTLAVAAVGVLAGVLMAAAAVWSWGGSAPVPLTPARVSVVLPANRPVAAPGSPGRSLALSPDGTQLVYVGTNLDAPADQPGGRTQLQLRSLGTLAVRDLPGTTGARQPFFSPDGQWVGFFTGAGELKKVSLAGGNPLTLVEKTNGVQFGFGVWTEDDTIIFTALSAGLRRVAAGGGEVTALTSLDAAQGEASHLVPALVPPSRAVLFAVTYRNLLNPRIEAVLLDSGERRVVLENAAAPLVSGGHLLFRRDEAVLITPFDTERLAVTGPAVPLVDEVQWDGPLTTLAPIPQLAVSRGGTLAYVPASERARTLGVVSRNGSFERLGPPPDDIGMPGVSPDGRFVAFIVARGAESEVHVYDTVRGSTTKLTQAGSEGMPAWHPDSRSMAVISRKKDTSGIYLRNLDGSERLLLTAPPNVGRLLPPSWSPDGKVLAYATQTGNLLDIWVTTTGDKPVAQALLNSPAAEHSPRFSPDGRWLAYVSDESGRPEIYARRYPQGERFAVSTGGGNGPVWRPDGKEIFFQGPSDGVQKLMAVSVMSDGDALRLGKPVPLFDMRVQGPTGAIEQYAGSGNVGAGYDILPDGRFVMVRGADLAGTREIVLVQHWFEELQRTAPAK